MITSPEASKHIERLSGLDFYPHNDKPALRELRLAGESAHSGEVLGRVVSEWLAEQSRCPKPAELRRMIHSAHAAYVRAKCKICDNSLWVVVFKLVTYKAGSFDIKSAEALDLNHEERIALQSKLGDNQAILSAAKPCVCMPGNHLYLTGERF